MLTVRDLLSWTTFVNTTEKDIGMDSAFIHGAFLVLLDGLGLGSTHFLQTHFFIIDRCKVVVPSFCFCFCAFISFVINIYNKDILSSLF
jgi:hypothetical protein